MPIQGKLDSHLQTVVLLAIALLGLAQPMQATPLRCDPAFNSPNVFPIQGLYSPATVTTSIVALASPGPGAIAVAFFVDSKEVWRATQSPFFLGPVDAGIPSGFDLKTYNPGPHTLSACATFADGTTATSQSIQLNLVSSINQQFSPTLAPYKNQLTAQQSPLQALVANTTTPGASLTDSERATRQAILAMYVNWGIDPSLDFVHDQSQILAALVPTGFAPPTDTYPQLSMQFSRDAPFYHQIPSQWPRVQLPEHYFTTIQLSEAYNGDGIGFGEVIATLSDPVLPIRSQWYDVASTLRTSTFRMPRDWSSRIPTNKAGDLHLIFVDPTTRTFISSYMTSVNPSNGGPQGLYITTPHLLGSLGDAGGSNAAGFADLPVLIQPGEATDPIHEIPHAIGGAIRRTWAARVFPASSWDAGLLTSVDSCSHKGFTNTGLIPYGGVIQLDPSLDLTHLQLSLPARRILRAMQLYGFYVMDFGCADLDIYTAINATELDAFGGPWGNPNGPGVQNEIQKVFSTAHLYVVPPLTKK